MSAEYNNLVEQLNRFRDRVSYVLTEMDIEIMALYENGNYRTRIWP